MKKIICSVFLGIIALSLFGMSANAETVFTRNPFRVNSNDYEGASFYNTYSELVTSYSAYSFNGSGEYKVGYDAYLYTNGQDVLMQIKDFNLPTNASGYFSLGTVGVGDVYVRVRAYNYYKTVRYMGWTGTQSFISR